MGFQAAMLTPRTSNFLFFLLHSYLGQFSLFQISTNLCWEGFESFSPLSFHVIVIFTRSIFVVKNVFVPFWFLRFRNVVYDWMRAYSLTILNSLGLSVVVAYCAIKDTTWCYHSICGNWFRTFTRIYVKWSYEKIMWITPTLSFFFV